MIGNYFPFLLFLLAIAAIFRDDFVFTLFYLFAGVYFVGRWWTRKALSKIQLTRSFPSRAFLGEEVQVNVEAKNTGWLPVVWLKLFDGLPIELGPPNLFRQVVSIDPKGRCTFNYRVWPRKRGYYPIGPMYASTGDLLGLGGAFNLQEEADYLIVYPKIVPIATLKLPSRSPLGTLRHNQPIYEDPSRVSSKRDYMTGDSMRRIDWKTTASTGRLQVKQFEPSIALETCIFLNLNAGEYEFRSRIYATELAIVVAASVANWVTGMKQSIGLCTNGVDPLGHDHRTQPIPPRKGRGHLMDILDILARVQSADTYPLADLVRRESVNLSWGTTMILVAGLIDERLFDELFQVRRSGLDVVLMLCGRIPNAREIEQKARYFGFIVHRIDDEDSLKGWVN